MERFKKALKNKVLSGYENRIVEINDVNGTAIAKFAYDALGRRIKKTDLVDSGQCKSHQDPVEGYSEGYCQT